jgi:Tfp pilus assembly protein PilX
MRLLKHLVRREEGITLILAILILATLTLTGTSLIYYASTNARSANTSKSSETAYSLAEAGIAQALSVLNQALNPMTATLLPSTTINLSGGTVTYSGTLSGQVWTITSTGQLANPAGGSAIRRTLTRSAQVYGLNNGATVGAWSRWYADNTSSCLTIQGVTITMPIATRGNLCMIGSAQITGASTTVEVGGTVTMSRETLSANRGPSAATGWTNSTNVFTSNNVDASVALAANAQSANLDVTGFGFSIPSGATIVGIEADVERAASNSSSIQDVNVLLLKGGSTSGISEHASGSSWPTSDTVRTYGSTSDLWGTTWTTANINASNFGIRLKVKNLNTSSSRTAFVDHVNLTVYYQPTPTTSIGSAGTPLSKASIVGTCKFDTQTAHTPCTSTDKVWASTIDTAPQSLSMPTVDMAYWYDNGMPGPKHNCTTGSFPGGFDNNSAYDNSLSGAAEVTPENSSYSCQVKDAYGNILGEISWNHVTHVLTIKGTIFVDGDFRFDDDGQVVHYLGRGIIYAAGDIEFDELVCAGGSGTSSCVDSGMANWDPTTNMMIVLAGGDAEYDQGSTQAQAVPSGFQGLIYAKGDCTVHENFHTSGPIVCNRIILPSSPNGWPTYYSWPPLGSLIAGQAYGNPNGASDFAVVPGPQSG